MLARAEVSSEAQLEKTLLPYSFKVLIEFMFLQRNSCKIAFSRAVGEREKGNGERGKREQREGRESRRDCF